MDTTANLLCEIHHRFLHRAMNINFPISFEFRKTQVEWVKASARFVGWGRRTDNTVDGGALMVEVVDRGIKMPLRYLRKRLPSDEWGGLYLEAYSDSDVETLLAGVEPLLLIPSSTVGIEDDAVRKKSQPGDPWELRDDFLRLDDSVDAALAFLNKWGRWNSEPFIELAECHQLHLAIRAAIGNEPEGWFADRHALPIDWRFNSDFPYFGVLTDKIESALRMTVTADLLNGAKFLTCARPDCGQPFKVNSKHARKYCSPNCGHMEAVRRSRAAKDSNGAS
jgi:hypothetical protein